MEVEMCCPVLRRTQNHTLERPEQSHIQYKSSFPIPTAIIAQRWANISRRVLWLLTSLAPSTAALQLTRLACLSKQASDTHTPHFREASQARLKTRHSYKPKQTVNSTKWTTISFSQKRSTDSASKIFFYLVRFYLTHVFFHLGACPITPTFCQCNCMHVLIHMQAVQQSF